jgi:hypothetical protein
MAIAGIAGGAFAASASHPFDTIKTRMQAAMYSKPEYRTWTSTAATIYKEGGVLNFWRGLLPRMTRIIGVRGWIVVLCWPCCRSIAGPAHTCSLLMPAAAVCKLKSSAAACYNQRLVRLARLVLWCPVLGPGLFSFLHMLYSLTCGALKVCARMPVSCCACSCHVHPDQRALSSCGPPRSTAGASAAAHSREAAARAITVAAAAARAIAVAAVHSRKVAAGAILRY